MVIFTGKAKTQLRKYPTAVSPVGKAVHYSALWNSSSWARQSKVISC